MKEFMNTGIVNCFLHSSQKYVHSGSELPIRPSDGIARITKQSFLWSFTVLEINDWYESGDRLGSLFVNLLFFKYSHWSPVYEVKWTLMMLDWTSWFDWTHWGRMLESFEWVGLSHVADNKTPFHENIF